MLVLPSSTVPAAFQRSTTVASYGATKFDSIRDPQVVSTPSVQKMSLWAIGTPVSGPPSPRARQLVGGAGVGQRAVGRDRDEGVQRRRQPLDAAEEVQREVEAGEPPGLEAGRQLSDGQRVQRHGRASIDDFRNEVQAGRDRGGIAAGTSRAGPSR